MTFFLPSFGHYTTQKLIIAPRRQENFISIHRMLTHPGFLHVRSSSTKSLDSQVTDPPSLLNQTAHLRWPAQRPSGMGWSRLPQPPCIPADLTVSAFRCELL